MEINKKNRTELKNYFLANKIPTQQHFAELIDACFNQMEDGIAKAPGNPIALAAEGDSAGSQEALHFFTSFEAENPNWAINLNPRVDAAVPGSNKPGLNVKDSSGQSRLFIKSGDGNVGIGTIEPVARLSIKGKNNVPFISAISAESDKSLLDVTQQGGAGVLTVQNGDGLVVASLNGNATGASFFLSKVGIGTTNPAAPLTIAGTGKENAPDTSMHITSQCILFGGNNAGKQTNSAKISAGTHTPDSLNIVGMGSTNQNRKVDIWAEGGMTVTGDLLLSGYCKSNMAVAFSAYIPANYIDSVAVLPLQALYNTGNYFNNTTYKFTAPVKGLYLFTMTVFKFGSDELLHWTLRLNGTQYVNGTGTVEPGERAMLTSKNIGFTFSKTVITTLNAGDVVHVEQTGKGYGDTYRSALEGVLLHALS